ASLQASVPAARTTRGVRVRQAPSSPSYPGMATPCHISSTSKRGSRPPLWTLVARDRRNHLVTLPLKQGWRVDSSQVRGRPVGVEPEGGFGTPDLHTGQ